MGIYFVLIFLVIVILMQEILHRSERKDLYNRIMSTDLTEYKGVKKNRTVKNIIKSNLESRK